MSSLKMTFSLASLILILGLVFVTAPVMAQIDQVAGLGSATVDSTPDNVDNLGVTGGVIPANGHLVLYKGDNVAASGLPAVAPSNAVFHPWPNMPDLEELFFGNAGGTIALKGTKTAFNTATPPAVIEPDYRFDHDGDDDGDATLGLAEEGTAGDGIKDGTDLNVTPKPTALTHPDSDPVDVAVNDAAITEIMWGLDNAVAGQSAVDDRQWIEIHNRRNVPLPVAGLLIHIKSGRPGSSAISKDDVPTKLNAAGDAVETIGRTVLDWFSNVDGNGWQNTPPGQNGYAVAADGNLDLRVDFVSMKRERGKLGKTEGTNLGHWSASTNTYLVGYKGTPGAAERTGPKHFSASAVSLDVVFNEVANHSNPDYEWFELFNPDGEISNLENWRIHIVTGVDMQEEFLTFPKLADGRYGNLLLVTKTDPAQNKDHPLALGYNVAKDDNGQLPGHDPTIRYYVAGDRWKVAMPDGDDSEFILILRSGNDKTNHEKVVDVAGYHSNLKKSTANFESSQWPLLGHGPPAGNHNQFNTGTVHFRRHTNKIGTGTTDGNKPDKTAFGNVGWQGIGYKRNAAATAANGGTPGYPNNALRANNDADAIAAIKITEVMAVAGERSLPTWIELQNMSNPVGVNLNGWRITIINHDSDGADGSFTGKLMYQTTLDGIVPAGQNYLITSRRGRDDTNLPANRIDSFDLKRTDLLLNPYGFQIMLEAKKDNNYFHVDTVGNLGPKPANSRRDDVQSFEPIAWELPMQMNEDGDRISLVRIADDGTMKNALRRYDMSNQIDTILDPTTYGHESDMGSPGHHPGGVLPVSLSKFRPERLKDTGQVVIRWITESELNNAGFNILRSDTRDGEFTKINKELIAGQGTTTERTSYTYTDTSAKPNVVYYYQIQDVSLDGNVTTLRTTHLRGNVTAAGKLTTTWGELKALQ